MGENIKKKVTTVKGLWRVGGIETKDTKYPFHISKSTAPSQVLPSQLTFVSKAKEYISKTTVLENYETSKLTRALHLILIPQQQSEKFLIATGSFSYLLLYLCPNRYALCSKYFSCDLNLLLASSCRLSDDFFMTTPGPWWSLCSVDLCERGQVTVVVVDVSHLADGSDPK